MTDKDIGQLLGGEAFHGGIDLEELAHHGVSPEQVIDFSSNILPFGPSPLVRIAVQEAALDRYPDRECRQLRQAIAGLHAIDERRILVGNGSTELIHLVAHTLLKPADSSLIVGPTFSEYARATRLGSGMVHECRAMADNGFAVPVSEIESLLKQNSLALVWICNPNNPTGQLIPRDFVLRWVKLHPRTLFVVDESYLDFSDTTMSLMRSNFANLVVLRSMTKTYAIAGLRLGFAVMSPEVLSRLRQRRIPWNVSSPAQAAGIAAIMDEAYYSSALAQLREAKKRFVSDLATRGRQPVPSDTNFFLLPINNASAVRSQLLVQGFVVRDCASFGIHDHLRLAVLAPEHNHRLSVLLSTSPLLGV